MPKYKPIRFKEPSLSELSRDRIRDFLRKHPVAVSTAQAVLVLAAIGGVLAVMAAAPGLTKLLAHANHVQKKENKERYRKLWKAFHAMKQKGLFEYRGEDKNGHQVYELAEKGIRRVKKFILETLEIKQPAKWDRKWRVVVFDIPEKFKKARRALQQKLKEIGFYPLQKSVWVYPFPCEAEITFLKDVFNIHPFVEILVVNEIENGKVIYHFQNIFIV